MVARRRRRGAIAIAIARTCLDLSPSDEVTRFASWGWLLTVCACSGGIGGNGQSSGNLGMTASSGETGDVGPDPDDGGPGGSGVDSTGSGGSSAEPSSTDGGGSSSGSGGTAEGDTGPAETCDTEWRVERAEGELTDLVYEPTADVVYAVGSSADGTAWAMALDPCDGTTLADVGVVHAGSMQTRLSGVYAGDAGVFVSGAISTATDPGNGLYARLDPTDLSTSWTAPLFGTTGTDEVLDLVVTAGDRVWMAGTSDYEVTPTAWGITGSLDGSACGFPWGGGGSGSARAVDADGDSVVVAVGTSQGELVLALYDSACTCMCTALDASDPITLGTQGTSVGDVLAVAGQAYVAGWASDTSSPMNYRGYVVWVNSLGVPIETYLDDATTDGEAYAVLASDGERIYAGGLHGWAGAAGYSDATGVLAAIPMPFDASPTPDWIATPTDIDLVRGLAVQDGPDGKIFAGGTIDGVAAIVRCDKAGTCG